MPSSLNCDGATSPKVIESVTVQKRRCCDCLYLTSLRSRAEESFKFPLALNSSPNGFLTPRMAGGPAAIETINSSLVRANG